jgi:general secretion pathway protein I
MPDIGESNESCDQAGRTFPVTITVLPTPNPSFRRVDAQVFDGEAPVLRLSTIVGRY